MKRRLWLIRVAFHDWMWDPDGKVPRLRAVAQRLPLYFSDPHWVNPKKLKGLVTTVGPTRNTTSAAGSHVTWTWNG